MSASAALSRHWRLYGFGSWVNDRAHRVKPDPSVRVFREQRRLRTRPGNAARSETGSAGSASGALHGDSHEGVGRTPAPGSMSWTWHRLGFQPTATRSALIRANRSSLDDKPGRACSIAICMTTRCILCKSPDDSAIFRWISSGNHSLAGCIASGILSATPCMCWALPWSRQDRGQVSQGYGAVVA